MYDFTFHTPTKVVFGKEAECQVGKLVKACNATKVLLHYGSDRVLKNGLMDRVINSLKQESISYCLLGGVVPNPRISLARKGVELCREQGVDMVIAVGGGSVIDSAKAIGYGVASGGDVQDFYLKKRVPTACLPIGTVLTIAAAGSEMSNSSVLTDEETNVKHGISKEFCRPVFSCLNPELTFDLPDYQTACGCTDIMMHTMERYFTGNGTLRLTDHLAEALLRTVKENALRLTEAPKDYQARAEVMWAGSLSHNGLMGVGSDGGDWVVHQLEHELGALYDVYHGAGLAAMWGSWARYVYQNCLERFVSFAINVMQVVPGNTAEETALKGIEAMENFYRAIHMPTNLKELGISASDEELHLMAHKCALWNGGKKGSAKVLYEEDMYNIYVIANQ